MKTSLSPIHDRLINFSVKIYKLEKELPKTRAGNAMAEQLLRAGTSPAVNYGKTCVDSSRKDIRCVMKDILMELRETMICLEIIKRAEIHPYEAFVDELMEENDELITIIEDQAFLPQKLNINLNSEEYN